MSTAVAVVVVAAAVASYFSIKRAYSNVLKSGIRPRLIVTTLTAGQLRDLFASTVATNGWKLVGDDSTVVVAQSPLAAGVRQQIAIEFGIAQGRPGRVAARLTMPRVTTNGDGTPNKAHTLRHRVNRFLTAVQAADSNAEVLDGVHV